MSVIHLLRFVYIAILEEIIVISMKIFRCKNVGTRRLLSKKLLKPPDSFLPLEKEKMMGYASGYLY